MALFVKGLAIILLSSLACAVCCFHYTRVLKSIVKVSNLNQNNNLSAQWLYKPANGSHFNSVLKS